MSSYDHEDMPVGFSSSPPRTPESFPFAKQQLQPSQPTETPSSSPPKYDTFIGQRPEDVSHLIRKNTINNDQFIDVHESDSDKGRGRLEHTTRFTPSPSESGSRSPEDPWVDSSPSVRVLARNLRLATSTEAMPAHTKLPQLKGPFVINEKQETAFAGPHTSVQLIAGPDKNRWLHVPRDMTWEECLALCEELHTVWADWDKKKAALSNSPFIQPFMPYGSIPQDIFKLSGPREAPYPLTKTIDSPWAGPHTAISVCGIHFNGWYMHMPRYLSIREMENASHNIVELFRESWNWGENNDTTATVPLGDTLDHIWFDKATKRIAQYLEEELGLDFAAADESFNPRFNPPFWNKRISRRSQWISRLPLPVHKQPAVSLYSRYRFSQEVRTPPTSSSSEGSPSVSPESQHLSSDTGSAQIQRVTRPQEESPQQDAEKYMRHRSHWSFAANSTDSQEEIPTFNLGDMHDFKGLETRMDEELQEISMGGGHDPPGSISYGDETVDDQAEETVNDFPKGKDYWYESGSSVPRAASATSADRPDSENNGYDEQEQNESKLVEPCPAGSASVTTAIEDDGPFGSGDAVPITEPSGETARTHALLMNEVPDLTTPELDAEDIEPIDDTPQEDLPVQEWMDLPSFPVVLESIAESQEEEEPLPSKPYVKNDIKISDDLDGTSRSKTASVENDDTLNISSQAVNTEDGTTGVAGGSFTIKTTTETLSTSLVDSIVDSAAGNQSSRRLKPRITALFFLLLSGAHHTALLLQRSGKLKQSWQENSEECLSLHIEQSDRDFARKLYRNPPTELQLVHSGESPLDSLLACDPILVAKLVAALWTFLNLVSIGAFRNRRRIRVFLIAMLLLVGVRMAMVSVPLGQLTYMLLKW